MSASLEDIYALRSDPRLWFECCGRYRDEETRQPTRGRANVLQRRVFAHYKQCQDEGRPCRMVVLKYRRAGSSTTGSALIYLHAHNYAARLGVIGTDYKASSNMLDMVKFYGEHDDFPGWSAPKVGATATLTPEDWGGDSFEDRVERSIATRIDFEHDSTVELYTSKNPESARSAGLSGYHATECGRWATGGEQDAGETLTAMRNTLPKKGFHLALEESTANGAQGAFYETCRGARWPEGQTWSKQWEHVWQLKESEFGKDLQFVFIFAAWYEDQRHVEEITPEQEAALRESLDDREQRLISRYGQAGPIGQRLGAEVEATVWQQLAWRRGIIKNVCVKGGADEFDAEYPEDPQVGFKTSGAPALDQEGLMAMEVAARVAQLPEYGMLSLQSNKTASWNRCPKQQAIFERWEEPIVGCKYLLSNDSMTGAEQITGSGEKDRHATFVIRDAYKDSLGRYHPVKIVARIMPPCQWEDEVLSRQLYLLSVYYGNCCIVVETNNGGAGIRILKTLQGDYSANLYQREELDKVSQKMTLKLGWYTSEATKRLAIGTLQSYVREQTLDCHDLHAIGEMQTLIVDSRGHVKASGSNHDDDCMGVSIGIECLPHATRYKDPKATGVRSNEPPDRWRMHGG